MNQLQLIEYIAKALVDHPEAVELKSSPSDTGTLYELKVAPDDVGKVIGRDGRTVNALRTVLTAAALKKGEKARLEILDDRKNNPRPGQANGQASGQSNGQAKNGHDSSEKPAAVEAPGE